MLIDITELGINHPKIVKANNEYSLVQPYDSLGNLVDSCQFACVKEIENRNTLVFLPAGYAQLHGNTSRQQYYMDLFINKCYEKDREYNLSFEPQNPYDKNAIGFYCKINSKTLHLGYVPSPLNVLVGTLMGQEFSHTKELIKVTYIGLKKVHNKYIAPVFLWKVNLPEVTGNVIQNRFTALLLED